MSNTLSRFTFSLWPFLDLTAENLFTVKSKQHMPQLHKCHGNLKLKSRAEDVYVCFSEVNVSGAKVQSLGFREKQKGSAHAEGKKTKQRAADERSTVQLLTKWVKRLFTWGQQQVTWLLTVKIWLKYQWVEKKVRTLFAAKFWIRLKEEKKKTSNSFKVSTLSSTIFLSSATSNSFH